MSATNVRAGGAYVEIGTNQKGFDAGLKRAEAKLRAFASSVSKISNSSVALAAGTAAPIAAVTKVFGDFDTAMRTIQASANPTAAEMDRLRVAIDSVSKDTGKGPTEVAGAFGELLKAGMSVEKVLAGAGLTAVQFARVGELQVAESAITMSDAMNAFGVDAATAGNVLSSAGDASSVSIQQIVQSFAMVSAKARDTNQSLFDTSAALALLGANGVKGSDAGTALRNMLTRLAAPTDEAATLLDRYGVAARDATGAVRPMRDLIGELQAKLGSLNAVAKSQALKTIFGDDAERVATIFITKGVAGFDEITKSMNGAKTVGQKFADVTGGVSGSVDRAKAGAERAAIAFGSLLAPSVGNALESLAGVVEKAKAWTDANAGLLTTLGSGAVKVAIWATGIAAAAFVVSKIAGGVVIATTTVRALSVALTALSVNPFVLAAAAAAALVLVMHRLNSVTAVYSDEARRAREEGDRQRAADLDKFDRLKQLADAEKLNANEMKEAGEIIKGLQSTYGQLGVSIDQTTGKIVGMTGAQEKLNEAMRKQALAQVQSEVLQAEANYTSARFALDAENQNSLANFGNLFGALTGDKSGALVKQNALLQASRELDLARSRRKALNAALSGDQDTIRRALTGGIGPAAGTPGRVSTGGDDAGAAARRMAAATEAAKRAAEDLGEIDEREANKRRSALLQELNAIAKVAEERRKLIDVMVEAERLKPKSAETEAKINALLQRRADITREQLKMSMAITAESTRQTLNALAAAAKEKLAAMAKNRNDIDAQLRLQERQQTVAEAENAAEKAKGTNGEESALKALAVARRALREEQTRQWKLGALADARERLGNDPAALAEAEKRINSLADRMNAMPDEVAAAESQFSGVRGTFSAIGAKMLGGPMGGDAKETAKATKATAEVAKGILDSVNEAVGHLRRLTFG